MRYGRRQWMGLAGAAGMSLAAACGPGPGPRPTGERAGGAGDLLYVSSTSGLSAINTTGGKVEFTLPPTLAPLAAPDWSRLFTTSPAGGTTRLATLDPRSGAERAAVTLDGSWDTAVASTAGRRVALVPHQAAAASPYMPVGRQRTTILVVDPAGRSEPQRFDLEGNFEPEAFSSDERALFLVEYLPPQAPDRYRVRQLNLQARQGQQQVQALLTRDKRPNLEEMRGTGRMQVFAPGCRTLFTLYTRQPDHVHARNMVELGGTGRPTEHVHAFVHVLSLAEGWAFCLDLPAPFGVGPASAHTLAASRDGHRLFVADASTGRVAAADTTRLQLTRPVELGTEPFTDWSRAAAESGPQGTLYLVAGSEVVALNPATLQTEQRWPVDGVARGLAVSTDGRRAYVGVDGRVLALDARSGRQTGSLAVPGVERIRHVALALA